MAHGLPNLQVGKCSEFVPDVTSHPAPAHFESKLSRWGRGDAKSDREEVSHLIHKHRRFVVSRLGNVDF